MMAESLMALRKEFEAGRAQLKAAHEEVRELRDRNIQLESEHSEMQVTCEQQVRSRDCEWGADSASQVSAARQEKFQLEQIRPNFALGIQTVPYGGGEPQNATVCPD